LILNWLARVENLRRAGEIDAPKAVRCSVTGLATNQAKVEFWRRETLPLPLAYLEEDELVAKLRDALALTEEIGEVLRQSVWSTSRQYLLPQAGNKALGRGQKSDINSLMERLAPGRAFWPGLEVPFKRFLVELADDIEHNEQGVPDYGKHVLPEWARTLLRTARFAFAEAVTRLGQDARALKATAGVEPSFRGRLFAKLKPYLQEVPHA
jgi:CRISPR system Cascade subunit CasA